MSKTKEEKLRGKNRMLKLIIVLLLGIIGGYLISPIKKGFTINIDSKQ